MTLELGRKAVYACLCISWLTDCLRNYVVDAVTVVLYNTMIALSEMEEIPVSQVSAFSFNFSKFTAYMTFVLILCCQSSLI